MAFFSYEEDNNNNQVVQDNCYCQNRGGFCPSNYDNANVPEDGRNLVGVEEDSFPKFVREKDAHYPNDLKQMEADTYEDSCCCEEECCCEENNCCCEEETCECHCNENNNDNDIILSTLQTLIESILILRKDIDEIKSKL